ncbi:MAG TPA: type VI secretion system membrane subunit TssM [Polyangia bacterium]|nr:type VI secretion system membrane subunit TssM [Polyangia bacterium]
MLKYIFAAIFIALAWALVLVFHQYVPLWPAIVATAVIAGGMAIYVIVKALMAQKAASAIEKELRAQAAQHAGGIRPDLRAEIAAMEAEFEKAVQTLKSSKLGRSGRDALGLLPWYVIIGPSASGKTTAIRNSGIKLPGGRSSKVRGVGGTRNCDWWMTNDAILLDTAGRWSTEEDDREEWLAFLDVLKRTRPKKPINGILLAVGAPDLTGSEEEIAALAGTLRERIDELTSRLDMVLPVYLMVTKCDLLSGFVETFGDLKDRERGQVWGFTLPIASEHENHVEAFAQNFDDLEDVLERNAVARMAEERRIEAREKIYAFPRQFDSLRQGLIDLVSNLFDQNVYQDAPIMRGVYFSSGTQEGRPIDRVMASMAEAFGVRPQAIAAPSTKPKSYFVRDLFQNVVFPDADVAVQSTRALQRARLVRWAVAGLALAASVAFLALPISSYLKNSQLLEDARRFVDKLAGAAEERGAGTLSASALENAEPMAARLTELATQGPGIGRQFGLYPGDDLLNPARLAVEKLLVVPLLRADSSWLLDFARGRGDGDEAHAQNGLVLTLLLTQPKAADEPGPENDHWRDKWVGVAATKAGEQWTALAGDQVSARARQSLENAVRFYAFRAASNGDLIERSAQTTQVVSRARAALLGAHTGDPLAEVLRDPALPRDVRLVDIVGGAVTVFATSATPGAGRQTGPSVPGAFTPAGWKVVKERIERLTADHSHDENAWVLAAPPVREGADAKTLRGEYFRRYFDAWKSFLLSLSIREPGNIDDARSLLNTIVSEKPLDAVWKNASRQLVFKDEDLVGSMLAQGKGALSNHLNDAKRKIGGGDDDAAAGDNHPTKSPDDELSSPEDIGQAFGTLLSFGTTKPTGLDSYGQILKDLVGVMGEKGAPDPTAFQTALQTARSKLRDLLAHYNDHNWEAALLEKMLTPPLGGTEVAVTGATGESANRKWCENVVVVFDQLLGGKYPFSASKSAHDVSLADVDKVFQPKSGVLWQYFTSALQNDFDHPADTTIFRLKDEPSVKYKPGLAAFLRRAQELTNLLYGRDGAKIGLAYAMRLRASAPYTKLIFESGGRKLTYFNTKERWEELSWPGRGAVFRTFQNANEGQFGFAEGEWALFHLMDAGRLTPTTADGEDYLAGLWAPPDSGPIVRADVKPPALWHAFRGIEIPRSIVVGSSGCHQ